MLSIISDAIIPIVLGVVGLVLLISPYDKIQDAFPGKSKKTIKIVGAFLLFCGIASILILLTYFL